MQLHLFRACDGRHNLLSRDCIVVVALVIVLTPGLVHAQQPGAAATSTDATELDRITVTGSRILRAGFDTLEPAAVVARETIEAYGHTNLIEALTATPSLTADISYRGGQATFGAGVNFLSRFGLGSNRMLTLVNGRRFVTSTPPTIFGAAGGNGVQVDLNAIPSVMVERVETIGIGGAPTYGSDAISGVTNIILRDKFEGAEVEIGFGSTTKHDNHRRSFSGIFGQGFANGRGHLTIAAQYDDNDGVNALQRDFYRQGYFLLTNPPAAAVATFQPGRTPANDGRVDATIPFNTGPADGIYDQIWVRHRRIASMTFGGVIFPADAVIARPYQRNGTGELYGFGANNTLWHFNQNGDLVEYNPGISYPGGNASGGDGLNLAETVPLMAILERKNVSSNGSFAFTDTMRGFFEFSYYNAVAHETLDQNVYNAVNFGYANPDGSGTSTGGALLFSVDNPYLSAASRQILVDNGITEFRLSRSSRDLSTYNASTETAMTRMVVGLDGVFYLGQRGFNWDASLTHGRGDFDYLGTTLIQQRFINAINVTTDAQGNIICDTSVAGTTVDPDCRPLNLFGERQMSQESLDYVSADTRADGKTRQSVFNASLTGGLFDLPGGEFSIAAGFEHRREKAAFIPSEYERLGQSRTVQVQSARGQYHTNEYFAEFLAPLIDPYANARGLQRLDLTAKVRRVDHSTAGLFTAYTYGFQLELWKGVQLRGNRTQSLRAPSIAELYTSRQPASFRIPEPCQLSEINGGSNPAIRRRNCEAFFAAWPQVDPDTFQASTGTRPGSSNGFLGLRNERADSWTAGIVLTPRWVRGLRIAVDWYDIEMTDIIAALSPNDIASGCFDNENFNLNDPNNGNRYCSLISRDSVTGVASGIATEYDNGPLRIFRGWTSEIDYRLDLHRFGRLDLMFYGYLPKNSGQAASAEIPFVETVGSFETPKRQFRWSAQHHLGNWSVGVMAHYTDRGRFNLTVTEENRQYLHRDSWTTWDANLGYRLTDQTRVNLSVINLADHIGPFPYVLDALGRRYMLTLKYNFR